MATGWGPAIRTGRPWRDLLAHCGPYTIALIGSTIGPAEASQRWGCATIVRSHFVH